MNTRIDERTHTTRYPRHCADAIRCLLFGWLLAAAVEYLCLPPKLRDLVGEASLAALSVGRVASITALGAVMHALLSHISRSAARWSLPFLFAVFAGAVICHTPSLPLLYACALVLGVLCVYAVRGWEFAPCFYVAQPAHALWGWLTAAAAVLFALFVGAWTVARVRGFGTPTYDFGIFSQMFYYMAEHGSPLTTLERETLLSHFAVHVSPIYYLMLPAYLLIPHPETLQVCQALILASAVLPLWKLGRHYGLSGAERTLLCLLFLLYPALAGGTSYDLHENCFLAPALLWLFYGIAHGRPGLTFGAAVLTLLVKEDAAVYVAVIGLWVIVQALVRGCRRRELLGGVLLLALSVGYFLAVTAYLREAGDGVMTGRYENLMPSGSSSLWDVIQTALCHPMKVLYECVDVGKLRYLALTMLPLLGLPLWTRRYERYLLLIPYLLVNLMPDYVYQHDIFFQYGFGSLACLFFLATVNLADLRGERGRIGILALSALVAAGCFGATVVPKAATYLFRAVVGREQDAAVRALLDVIPDDAAVAATTFYTTELARREILYDIGYCTAEQLLGAEYIVVQVGMEAEARRHVGEAEDARAALEAYLHRAGYVVGGEIEDVVTVYRRK